MEISGTIKAINPTETISERFKKREFVVVTEPTTPYPQPILVQVTQDKCHALDSFKVGDSVKCQINLRGREFNGQQGTRYYNTVECWNIQKIQN